MVEFRLRLIFALIFLFLYVLPASSQEMVNIPVPETGGQSSVIENQPDGQSTESLSIVFAGDIMGHDGQINAAWYADSNRFIYEPVFRYIKDYISKADLAVANLEVTLAGPPYKGYPEFSSPDELMVAAAGAGFDIFLQANNHALDRGSKGFVRTISVLDSLSLMHTGTFVSDSAREALYPLIIEKNNIKIALLNYTYGTNGLKIPPPFTINMIDTATIRKDIRKARLQEPDYIIATIHWGNEYENSENRTQQDLAAFIFASGADIIIGSHPHVVQPVKKIYTSDSTDFNIVVYSLGNFVSNQRDRYRDGGIMFGITLERQEGVVKLTDYSYLPYWVYRESKPERNTFYVVPVSFYENNPGSIVLNQTDKAKLEQFAGDTRANVTEVPESDFYDRVVD